MLGIYTYIKHIKEKYCSLYLFLQYWNDYKSKLKKIVASNRASNQRTGGGQSEATSLSDIEKRFLQILGTSFGSGLAGVRVEPFNPVSS
jgi:hypothetical protein